MLSSIEGVYRNGRIELSEVPTGIENDTFVIVTFLQSGQTDFIDLRARGIDEKQAANLRARLSTFAEEWDSPEMEMYDDYDRTKSHV